MENRYIVGLGELPACGITAVNGDADDNGNKAFVVGLIFLKDGEMLHIT